VPGGIKNLRLAKSHHWLDLDMCQGRIGMELDGPTLLEKPIIEYFGKEAH
jgi:hypothetical protein